MSNTTSNSSSLLRPEEVAALVIEPLSIESVAMQTSTVVHINSHEYRIPVLTGDPDTSWVAEGAEIPIDQADFGEVLVSPGKCSGITLVTRELSEDGTPEATRVIGQRLVQSLKRKIDSAWFASATTDGPSGLGSITPSVVDATAGVTNVDAFLEAVAAAEQVGAKIDSFVAHPSTILNLAKLKKATGSSEPLLSTDAAGPAGRTVAGTPLIASPDAPVTAVWGIPKAFSQVVIRRDPEVTVDSSAFFTSDRLAVRATVRVGFGFAHPAALVRIDLGLGGS